MSLGSIFFGRFAWNCTNRRWVALARQVEGIAHIVVCEHCGTMRRMYLTKGAHRTGRQIHLLLLTLVLVAQCHLVSGLKACDIMRCVPSSGECFHLMSAFMWWMLSSGECCHLVSAVIIWWVSGEWSYCECCYVVSAMIWWVLSSGECCHLVNAVI